MHLKWCLVFIGALVLGALALSEPRTILEALKPSARAMQASNRYGTWALGDKVEDHEKAKLIFALKQQNLKELEDLWYKVSTPGSDKFGQFLSRKQVSALVAPREESVRDVLRWLEARGQHVKAKHQNDFIIVETTIAEASDILGAPFHWFTNIITKQRFARIIGDYSLPSTIAKHIDFVGGVRRLPRVQKVKKVQEEVENGVAGSPGSWGAVVDPNFLRTLYRVGNASSTNPKNSQSVVQFLAEYYATYDLSEFFTLFYPRAYGRQPTVIGPNYFGAGAESSLDIEYIMSVGDAVPTTFWSNADDESPTAEPFLTWLLDVDKTETPPLVFSVSYGDNEDDISEEYSSRTNVELQKQGVRGISVLFASGDSGVGGDGGSKCTKFSPDFPATSPYATSVGGTYSTGLLMNGPESALYLSGGGFSNLWDQPAYQRSQVEGYLKTAPHLPAASYFNRTGRAYPDVSAQAWNFIIVVDTTVVPGVAGTSCAAPTFAGIVALLNDIRLNAGKPPIGPLNPLLYKMAAEYPSTFTDIQSGSNPGCNTEGFQATKGWDPASGLGTPVYSEMARYILKY